MGSGRVLTEDEDWDLTDVEAEADYERFDVPAEDDARLEAWLDAYDAGLLE